MDDKKLAQAILKYVGGPANVRSDHHQRSVTC